MSSQYAAPPEVFVSYSHLDKDYKNELVKQLNILQRQGVISTWHDGLLIAGEQWNKGIIEHLNSSRIILLLISPDFMNSDYIHNVELKRASERHESGAVTVIPVLVRNVNSWENEPFGNLKLGDFQALPTGAEFIVEWENADKAFTDVARGIQEAAEKPEVKITGSFPRSAIPRPPIVGFVVRRDSDGRDIVERLKEELAPNKNQLIVLSGPGGVGKTTLAAETARALSDDFGDRLIWISALGREDFTLSTVLDEIATQLGHPELRPLAPEPKAAQVQALLAAAPTLIILDNFETIKPEQQTHCIDLLFNRASCPVLITTREKITAARNVVIPTMSPTEANDFLQRLIEQSSDQSAFAKLDRDRIMQASERNALVLQWVVGQIDLAQDADSVLDELAHGVGDAAQRVFDRSFRLEQLGDDGRAVLLALSSFAPDASRPALAEVAGFGEDLKRLNDAVKRLASLWLLKTAAAGSRLTVEGLTRELAKARLLKDDNTDDFRQRFVTCFLSYAKVHSQPTPENFDALETEKDNVLGAIDAAFVMKDSIRVIQLMDAISFDGVNGYLTVRGYWDEAIRRGEQALKCARDLSDEVKIARFSHNLAITYQSRGDLQEARRLYNESLEITKRLGNQGGIAISLHQLAMLAQDQGELDEARRLYNESLEIEKRLGHQGGIAISLHQLARLAQDQGELDEARRLYNESLEINKTLGNQGDIAKTLHELARLAQAQGELDEARRLYNESLEIKKRLGNQGGIASTTSQLGIVHHQLGESAESRAKHEESLAIRRKLGDQKGVAIDLHQLARLAQDQGELDQARRLYNESLEINKRLGNQGGIAITMWALGILNEDEGDSAEAERLLAEALAIFERLKSPNAKPVRESLARVKGESSE